MRTNCVRCGQFRNSKHRCIPAKIIHNGKVIGYLNERKTVVENEWNPIQSMAKWSLAVFAIGVFYHFASLLAQVELNHFFL